MDISRLRLTSADPRLWYVTVADCVTSSSYGHSARVKLTLGGCAMTSCVIAWARSRRPAPCAYGLRVGFGADEPISAAFTCAGDQSGCCCRRIAAAPATCGAAIDVPDKVRYGSPGCPSDPVELLAATICHPGAVRSGLSAPSIRGPRLEKDANRSVRSTAPTVSAESALPGDQIDRSTPALPAEITNRVPNWAVRFSTACSTGSNPAVSNPPRLMLMTSAPCSAAHCMPARIDDSGQPSRTHTLPSSSCAPGATPRYWPPEAAPLPAMVDATWVPCPMKSPSCSRPSVKFSDPMIRPDRSGWVASTPVSSTATVIPEPSSPPAQACGAPTCGTLWSSSGCRSPSSHTAGAPELVAPADRSVGAPDAVIASGRPTRPSQNPPSVDLSTRTAEPPTAGRSRTTSTPSVSTVEAADGAASRPAARFPLPSTTINGRSGRS